MLTLGKFYKIISPGFVYKTKLNLISDLENETDSEEWIKENSIFFPLEQGRILHLRHRNSSFFDIKILFNGKIRYLTIRILTDKFNYLDYFQEL